MKSFTAFALLVTIASGAGAPAAAQAPYPARGLDVPIRVVPLAGTCAAAVKPDRAAIVGGVASGGLKPADAVAQLDRQLGAMRTQVEADGGQLRFLERVRTVKAPAARSDDKEPPFQVVQRLRAEFPAAAPVDVILQRMIELGLDRFGDKILYGGSSREAVVRFTVADLPAKLAEMERRCTADAWKVWCARPDGACATATAPADLQFQSFTVRSEERVLRPDGGVEHWHFNVNRSQRTVDAPELLDNITVHLTGNISLLYYVKDAVP